MVITSAVIRTRAKTLADEDIADIILRSISVLDPPSRVACVERVHRGTCKLTITTLDDKLVVAPRSP